MAEGYNPNIFVDKVDSFICYICYDVLKEPQCLDCGHHLCFSCAQDQMGKKCGLCRHVISQTHLDIDLEFIIGSLSVHCPNEKHGCTTPIVLYGLDIHVEFECLHVPTRCKRGCGFESMSIDKHTIAQCIENYMQLYAVSQAEVKRHEAISQVRLFTIEHLSKALENAKTEVVELRYIIEEYFEVEE